MIDNIIRLLKDANIKTYLVDKGHSGLKVSIRLSHKPEVSYYIGKEKSQNSDILIDTMNKEGLLDKVVYGNTVACPYCGSIDNIMNIKCPKCHSIEINRKYILQHIRCGKSFPSDTLRLDQCPMCGEKIGSPDELNAFGSILQCLSCNASFESPEIDLHCNECGSDFNLRDAEIRKIYTYELSENANAILELTYLYISITDELTKSGYKVESPGTVVGESGVSHEFPMIIKAGNDDCIIIDITGFIEPLNQEKLLREYIKIIDTPQCQYIYLVKEGNRNPDLKVPPQLSKKLQIIHVNDVEEAVEKVKSSIGLKGER